MTTELETEIQSGWFWRLLWSGLHFLTSSKPSNYLVICLFHRTQQHCSLILTDACPLWQWWPPLPITPQITGSCLPWHVHHELSHNSRALWHSGQNKPSNELQGKSGSARQYPVEPECWEPRWIGMGSDQLDTKRIPPQMPAQTQSKVYQLQRNTAKCANFQINLSQSRINFIVLLCKTGRNSGWNICNPVIKS